MDPITVGASELTEFQCDILADCITKKNGGLCLPMGTGKTLISLMTALHLTDECILVVASKTLIHSWIYEIKKFFKNSLKYEVLHGEIIKNINTWKLKDDTRVVLTTSQFLTNIYKTNNIENSFVFYLQDGFITTKYYNPVNKPYLNNNIGGSILYSKKWGVLIVDEIQSYTNINTYVCKALATIYADYRWVLSGTMFAEPRFERIFGYYLILNDPEVPRSLPECIQMITSRDYKGIKNTLIYRNENINYKPPKINSQIVNHPLTENERKIYLSMKQILHKLNIQLNEYMRYRDTENTHRFSSYILAMLSYLRQGLVCPLIPITTVTIDIADLECKSELSQLFSQEIAELNLNEWLNNPDAMRSTRINACLEKINLHKNDRIIVFSCFKTCLSILNVYLPKNREIFTLNSNTNTVNRGKILDKFGKSENGILLLTYDLGSNGLNLQCSNTVLLLDFWWNASKTKQAISRVIRYGQKADTVNVYYFTSNTGLEENLYKKQKHKLMAAEELLDGSIQTKIPKLCIKEILKFIDTDDNIKVLEENYL
jgi:SNF2 family DNA or RNA helicase